MVRKKESNYGSRGGNKRALIPEGERGKKATCKNPRGGELFF